MEDKLWELKPHTQTKHLILKRYFDAWLPIMAAHNGRILYIDGFAGRGRYVNNEPGSPLIALKAVSEHPRFKQWKREREVLFLFIEKHVGYARSLEVEIADFANQNHLPSWVKYEVKHGDFTTAVNTLLERVANSGLDLPPTFAFIDPFNYRVPLSLVSRLTRFPRCECFVNFMYKFINWATHRKESVMHKYLDDLFGTPIWRDVRGETDPDRRQDFLVALYKQQLHEQARLNYVRTFEMIDDGNRTEYVLFFGTNSRKGLSEMKRAMWRADPEGGRTFTDRTDPRQMVMFEPTPSLSRLRRMLLDRFGGKEPVDIGTIETFVLFETPFSESIHLRSLTLGPMEKAGSIEVTRPPTAQKRIGTYPEGSKLKFLPGLM